MKADHPKSEFDSFKDMTQKLLAVPKDVVRKREQELKSEPKKRGRPKKSQ